MGNMGTHHIVFKRTFDMELVRRIMTHPAIYEGIADDFYPAADNFLPMESPNLYYMVAKAGEETLGLYITHPINRVLWELHHALYPRAYRRRGAEIAKAFEEWLFGMTPCVRAMGFTPACNRLALRYAVQNGMELVGVNRQCYMKRGKLWDQIIFGKSKN